MPLLALAGYAPSRLLLDPTLGRPRSEVAAEVAAVLFGAILPALLAAAAYSALTRGPSGREATLLFLLGTPLFCYGIRLHLHAATVACTVLALTFAERALRGGERRAAFLAGVAAGAAVTMHYLAGVTVVMIGALLLLPSGPRLERTASYGLGLLGPLVPLCLYQWAVFGGPFTSPYAYWVQPGGLVGGLGGAALPDVGETAAILWTLVAFTLPVTVGLCGAARATRDPRRPLALVCLAASFLYLITLLLQPRSWHGGPSWGARYYLTAIPFALRFLPDGLTALPRAARVGVLGWSLTVGLLGAFATTHAWPRHATSPADLVERVGDLLRDGPRLPALYVAARSGAPLAVAYVPLASAAILCALAAAGWWRWRRTEPLLARVALGLGVVTLALLA